MYVIFFLVFVHCISFCLHLSIICWFKTFHIYCPYDMINFVNLFYYLIYFYYYLWVLLYFLVLFIDFIILFQLNFTFIYSNFSKKFSILTKVNTNKLILTKKKKKIVYTNWLLLYVIFSWYLCIVKIFVCVKFTKISFNKVLNAP